MQPACHGRRAGGIPTSRKSRVSTTKTSIEFTLIVAIRFPCCRIVRNKAAEKAKHVHQQQQQQQGQTNSGSAPPQTISVITHAPPVITSSPHDTTTLQRTGSYSINGILGIAQSDQHLTPSKRKREEPIGKKSTFYLPINSINFVQRLKTTNGPILPCMFEIFDLKSY